MAKNLNILYNKGIKNKNLLNSIVDYKNIKSGENIFALKKID